MFTTIFEEFQLSPDLATYQNLRFSVVLTGTLIETVRHTVNASLLRPSLSYPIKSHGGVNAFV